MASVGTFVFALFLDGNARLNLGAVLGIKFRVRGSVGVKFRVRGSVGNRFMVRVVVRNRFREKYCPFFTTSG